MQQLSRTLKEAIRGSYQIPMAKIEIIDQDGTTAGEILDVIDVSLNVSSSRNILRNIKISLENKGGKYTPDPDMYDRNLLWYNKKMKLYYAYKTTAGEEWLPQGLFNINNINPSVDPTGTTLELEGQDVIENLVEDQFDDIYKIEVTSTESANYALASQGGSATASSSISAGDQIQDQAQIHFSETFATVNGLAVKVENESEKDPSNMVKGNYPNDGQDFLMGSSMIYEQPEDQWLFIYTPKEGETVTGIEANIFVDLKDPLNLQKISIHLIEGAELTDFVYTSPDNAIWTSYTSTLITPSDDVRFIRFKIRKTYASPDGSWRLGVSKIEIRTGDNFAPTLAIDGDLYNTDWRPKPTDPDPVITFDLGSSRSINALYTYWGKDSFDFWNRVNYYIETSANGSTWSRLQDLNGYDESSSFYGEVEHVFNPISVRYVRINIKGRDGVAILRHIRIMSITPSKSIRDLMIEILQTTGIQEYEIPYTRRYIERKMAEIGDDKEGFLRSLARSANWEVGTDENGVYKAYYRDIDPVRYAWHFTTDEDNIFSFGLSLGNDIKNVIVVTNESSSSKAIVGRAIDDNPLSPTSTANLGRRVIKYTGESYNSQEICDRVAQERLFEKVRQKHQTSLPVTGHPAIQVDDVVLVTVEEAKIKNVYYLVTGFETSLKAESAEFDTRINISQL